MATSHEALRRTIVNLTIVAISGVGASRGAYQILVEQAKIARRVIPKPTDRPYDGDGLYRPGSASSEPWRLGMHADVHLMIFGDSLAAGLGAEEPGKLPGVLLARGLAEESGQDVRLSIKAIVGATSKSLVGQIEAMQIAGGSPDVSVILIGGNDITARNSIASSARRLGEAVETLVAAGSVVVVGTCPDLGTIKPVPQPLRSVMHTLSRRLSAAQTSQVRKAGGIPVSLAESLAPEFHARGEHLFAPDRFHPNSAGYELAAGLLLPAVCSALGVWDTETAGPVEPLTAPDGEPVLPPPEDTSDSVVARLTSRLAEFVRTHEDRGDIDEVSELHNKVVDSSAEDPAAARRAVDVLRRRSRILRRTGSGQPPIQTN